MSSQRRLSSSVDERLAQFRAVLLDNNTVLLNAQAQRPCVDYDDVPSAMTGGRLVARFLARFRWYYPRNNNQDTALDRAWAHYEHVTLGRIYTDTTTRTTDPDETSTSSSSSSFVRAPPGEKKRPTALYPLIQTPTSALSAFGTSVRLYFNSLLLLALFLSLAAVLNLPLGYYFSQSSYSQDAKGMALDWAVQASAVCADTEWVPCTDCAEHQSEFHHRVNDQGYYLKNTCNFDDWLVPALGSYAASLLLIVLFGVAFFGYERQVEIVFDEQIQTASDYSIKVCNPPADAVRVEEWKHYFERFGKVLLVTVAIDNASLLEALVQRRRLLNQLRIRLPPLTNLDDETSLRQAVEAMDPSCCSGCHIPILAPSTHHLCNKVLQLNQLIRQFTTAAKQYRAVSVYVTFDTERAQRNALHVLSTGKIHRWRNTIDTRRLEANNRKLKVCENAESSTLSTLMQDVVDPTTSCTSLPAFDDDHNNSSSKLETHCIQLVQSDDTQPERTLLSTLRFRGERVLYIKEAPEPSNIRWKDLQVSKVVRATKYFATICAMLCFIGWSALLIWDVETKNPGTVFTPIFITITNILVPKICEIVNAVESHSTEGARQSSLYIKVVLFRCFNSAIALLIVKGFTGSITLDEQNKKDNLNQAIYNLIFAEMFTIPIIKLVDVMGIVRKHILAPRAKDQEEMNSYFVGAKFELAERYTDATKVLFVSLMYSAVLPVSLLLGAMALVVHYVVGKFCLLRMWRDTPDVGPTLSRLSRNYFFSTSLIAHSVMSAFWWSGYPYDDLCESEENGGYYKYCSQDFRKAVFPPLPRFQSAGSEWMTESQAIITSLYAWTSCVMIIGAIIVVIKSNLIPKIRAFFYSSYEPDGKDQGISFSSVITNSEVHGYFPMLRERGFAHPLIACDLSGIDLDLVRWKAENFDAHNLVEDARCLLGDADFDGAAFSRVQQWK